MTEQERQTKELVNAVSNTQNFSDQFSTLTPYNFQADSFLGINLGNLFKSKKRRQQEEQEEQEEPGILKRKVLDLDALGLGKKDTGYRAPKMDKLRITPEYIAARNKHKKSFDDTFGGKILNGLAGLLTGDSGGSILSTAENPIVMPDDVIIQSVRKKQTDKSAQTIFYVLIGLLLIVMLIVLLKKTKK